MTAIRSPNFPNTIAPGVFGSDTTYGAVAVIQDISKLLDDKTFQQCLESLAGFADQGRPPEEGPRKRVLLGPDSAPFSLTYNMQVLNRVKGKDVWETVIFGGLIFHSSSRNDRIYDGKEVKPVVEPAPNDVGKLFIQGEWSLHS